MTKFFLEELPDFKSYLIDKAKFESSQTYSDYLSRLKYVSQFVRLDKTFGIQQFNEVIEYLNESIDERSCYKSKKGINDLKSGLNVFLEYAQSDYAKSIEDTILSQENEIKSDTSLSITEKEALIKSRVGQGVFRKKLIDFWGGCSVTQCGAVPLLMASHIKPWKRSDNSQRLDLYNGLLLTPNLDKLFDGGYITFNPKNGKIVCSDVISANDMNILGVKDTLRLTRIDEHHVEYLNYHKQYCFKG